MERRPQCCFCHSVQTEKLSFTYTALADGNENITVYFMVNKPTLLKSEGECVRVGFGRFSHSHRFGLRLNAAVRTSSG